jgi:hypothetical protein
MERKRRVARAKECALICQHNYSPTTRHQIPTTHWFLFREPQHGAIDGEAESRDERPEARAPVKIGLNPAPSAISARSPVESSGHSTGPPPATRHPPQATPSPPPHRHSNILENDRMSVVFHFRTITSVGCGPTRARARHRGFLPGLVVSSVDQFGFKRLAGLQLADAFDCKS